jgi:hypothetical protein
VGAYSLNGDRPVSIRLRLGRDAQAPVYKALVRLKAFLEAASMARGHYDYLVSTAWTRASTST